MLSDSLQGRFNKASLSLSHSGLILNDMIPFLINFSSRGRSF